METKKEMCLEKSAQISLYTHTPINQPVKPSSPSKLSLISIEEAKSVIYCLRIPAVF